LIWQLKNENNYKTHPNKPLRCGRGKSFGYDRRQKRKISLLALLAIAETVGSNVKNEPNENLKTIERVKKE
jgi:hypothetical protein